MHLSQGQRLAPCEWEGGDNEKPRIKGLCVSVCVFVCTPYYPDTTNIVWEDDSVRWLLEDSESMFDIWREKETKTDMTWGGKGFEKWR